MESVGTFIVVILTHGGSEAFIELLAKSECAQIALVLLERARVPQRTFKEKMTRSLKYDGPSATVSKLISLALGDKTSGREELLEVKQNQAEIIELCAGLGIETAVVDDYHSEESKEKLRSVGADLGVLYGTNIIRKSVFSIPKLGSINLHQGLAPFYRGGPSIFWELFNGEEEVGITVHYVASSVDTGDILVQDSVPLKYDYEKYGLDFDAFLNDFRAGISDKSAALVVEAIESIANGTEKRHVQNPELGERYRIPTFNQKKALIRRLKERLNGNGAKPADSH